MRRKLLLVVVLAALVGFAVFWIVTIPSTVPASALSARTADMANGPYTKAHSKSTRSTPLGGP